jgi:FlgD Ig-like domain/Bacterial Ig-like domain
VRYTLPSAVSDLRVDVVDAADRVVRRLALGAQPAGAGVASWDGRATDGTAAPDGRYLMKVIVTTTSGEVIASPSATGAPNVVARWGLTLDRTAPRVSSANPAPGTAMLPASTRPTVVFSEQVVGLSSTTVRLERVGGSAETASVFWNAAARTLTVTPADPLSVDASYRLSIGVGVADSAGNPLPAWTAAFTTAPGTVFDPYRRVTVVAGTHTAYGIGAAGDVTSARTVVFARASGASVSQRATLPNLPGRWLYVENGTWAGLWLPEAPGTHLAGETERSAFPSTTRLIFAAGSHTGYQYASTGEVSSSRSATLAQASGANVSARAIINGRPHWLVTNGIWAGWWMPESARAHRAGYLDQTALSTLPRIALQGGMYTGYEYDTAGRVTSTHTATLARASGAPVSAWAVINGRPHYLVAAGIWADTWLPVDGRVTLAP